MNVFFMAYPSILIQTNKFSLLSDNSLTFNPFPPFMTVVIYSLICLYTSRPLVRSAQQFGLKGLDWQDLCRGPLDIAGNLITGVDPVWTPGV